MHPLNGVRKNLDCRQITSKTKMSNAYNEEEDCYCWTSPYVQSHVRVQKSRSKRNAKRQLAAQLTRNKCKEAQLQCQLNKMGHKTHITTRKAVELKRIKYYEQPLNPYSRGTNLLQI